MYVDKALDKAKDDYSMAGPPKEIGGYKEEPVYAPVQ